MLKVSSDSIIYVFCPSKTVTWWPECLHQLAFKLNKLWYNAKMVYYPKIDNPMPEVYNKYYPNIDSVFCDWVIENENNFIVVPEISVKLLDQFKNINKSIWWLSVDNAEKKIGKLIDNAFFLKIFNKLNIFTTKNNFFNRLYGYIKYILAKKIWKINFPDNRDIVHFYQSKYAENFVLKNKWKHLVYPLKDYINQEFIINSGYEISEKENIIVYNPFKWIQYTTELIQKYWTEFKFVPIKNMTPKEVQLLLKRAKVYIDFWNHPWRDRIPREAALQWCCIITNTNWSAWFFEDIPILNKYIFEEFDSKRVYEAIVNIFNNYNDNINDFEYYREKILKWEETFENQILDIFIRENA